MNDSFSMDLLVLSPRRHASLTVKSQLQPETSAKGKLKHGPAHGHGTNKPEALMHPALLTSRISHCMSNASLFSLLYAHQTSLNPIHLAAATKALLRMSVNEAAIESSRAAKLIQSLLVAIGENHAIGEGHATGEGHAPSHLLLACPTRELSSITWACCQLFGHSQPLAAVLSEATKIILSRPDSEITPQGICNLAWSFATWSQSCDTTLIKIIESALIKTLHLSEGASSVTLSSQDVSMLFWSMARLEHLPSTFVIEKLSFHMLLIHDTPQSKSKSFTSQGLANIIWAAGSLSRHCGDDDNGLEKLRLLYLVAQTASSRCLSMSFKAVELSALITGLSLAAQSSGDRYNKNEPPSTGITPPSLFLTTIEGLLPTASAELLQTKDLAKIVGIIASISSSLVPFLNVLSTSSLVHWIQSSVAQVSAMKDEDLLAAKPDELATMLWATCKVASYLGAHNLPNKVLVCSCLSRLTNIAIKAFARPRVESSSIAKVAWACKMKWAVIKTSVRGPSDVVDSDCGDFLIAKEAAYGFLSQALRHLSSCLAEDSSLGMVASILWAASTRFSKNTYIPGNKLSRVAHTADNFDSEGWGVVSSSRVDVESPLDLEKDVRWTRLWVKNNIHHLLRHDDSVSDLTTHENNVSALSVACSRLGLHEASFYSAISQHLVKSNGATQWRSPILSSIGHAMSNSNVDAFVPISLSISLFRSNGHSWLAEMTPQCLLHMLWSISMSRKEVDGQKTFVRALIRLLKVRLANQSLSNVFGPQQVVKLIYSMAILRYYDSKLLSRLSSLQLAFIKALSPIDLVIFLWSASTLGYDMKARSWYMVQPLILAFPSLDLNQSITLLWALAANQTVRTTLKSNEKVFLVVSLLSSLLDTISHLLSRSQARLSNEALSSLCQALGWISLATTSKRLSNSIDDFTSKLLRAQSFQYSRAKKVDFSTIQVLTTLFTFNLKASIKRVNRSYLGSRKYVRVECNNREKAVALMFVSDLDFSSNFVDGEKVKELLGAAYNDLEMLEEEGLMVRLLHTGHWAALRLRYQRRVYIKSLIS